MTVYQVTTIDGHRAYTDAEGASRISRGLASGGGIETIDIAARPMHTAANEADQARMQFYRGQTAPATFNTAHVVAVIEVPEGVAS